MSPRAREPSRVGREAARVRQPFDFERAHDVREAERVAVSLFVTVEGLAAPLIQTHERDAARARDDRRALRLVSADAEVNAFEPAQRVGQLSAVRLLSAVERRVAAEPEGGRGDAASAPRPSHVAHDLVARTLQAREQMHAAVLFEVHAVVGEENNLRLRPALGLYVLKQSVERAKRYCQTLGAADVQEPVCRLEEAEEVARRRGRAEALAEASHVRAPDG